MMIGFHGSPGTPDDFSELNKYLSAEHRIVAGRYSLANRRRTQSGHHVIGYSWGCGDAALYAATADEVDGLVLISPYLFPTQRTGIIARTVLKTPFLGDFLLRSKSVKIVDDFLKKSSHPQSPPISYQLHGETLKNPQILKAAVFEKAPSRTPQLKKALKQIASRKIPVWVIRGTEDQTSEYSAQIKPLHQTLGPQLTEITFPNAGHALLWTHSQELIKTLKENGLV